MDGHCYLTQMLQLPQSPSYSLRPYWSEVLSLWVSKVVGQWEGHEMPSVVDTDARSRPWHLYNTYLLAWHLCLRALSLHFLLWKVQFFTARATHRTLSSHVGVKPRPQTSASHVNAVQQEEEIPLSRQAHRSATIPTKNDSLTIDTWHNSPSNDSLTLDTIIPTKNYSLTPQWSADLVTFMTRQGHLTQLYSTINDSP